MNEHSIERRRLGLALVAAIVAAPAAIFFAAAIGRLLQPSDHEPARTLQAIFDAFGGLAPAILGALVIAGPLVALAIGGYLVVTEWGTDPALRADVVALAAAAGRLRRRPAFVIGLCVAIASGLMTAVLLVHAVAG